MTVLEINLKKKEYLLIPLTIFEWGFRNINLFSYIYSVKCKALQKIIIYYLLST